MKTFPIILIPIMLLASCKSISYESAVSTNKDKFYGDEKKTALLLVDFKNLSQSAADISDLAPKNAYAKDICDFADIVVKDQQSRKMPLKLLALKKGVKLPTVVDMKNQKVYHSLQEIRDEKTFDKEYCSSEKQIFSDILTKCDSFLADNTEGPVRDFLIRQSGIYKNYFSKISDIEKYIDQNEPQPLTEK